MDPDFGAFRSSFADKTAGIFVISGVFQQFPAVFLSFLQKREGGLSSPEIFWFGATLTLSIGCLKEAQRGRVGKMAKCNKCQLFGEKFEITSPLATKARDARLENGRGRRKDTRGEYIRRKMMTREGFKMGWGGGLRRGSCKRRSNRFVGMGRRLEGGRPSGKSCRVFEGYRGWHPRILANPGVRLNQWRVCQY